LRSDLLKEELATPLSLALLELLLLTALLCDFPRSLFLTFEGTADLEAEPLRTFLLFALLTALLEVL